MSGLYGVLQTGMRSLLAQQSGIEVTGHNIANVNTPGYSRQKTTLETSTPIPSPQGTIGTGVSAKEVVRIYDRFLGLQINNASEDLGRWEAQENALERVEIVFNEASGSGLNQAMADFFNAWQDLANNPSGNVERLSLLGKSENMTSLFQQTYDSLAEIQTDLDAAMAGMVEEINLKAAEIATLNQKIVVVEAGGDNANDYRDKRDLAVNDLSLMIDISTSEESTGSLSVTLGGGSTLVTWNSSRELSTMTNTSGHKDVAWASAPTVGITSSISSGKLKGWIEVRDVIIPGYMSDLENLTDGIKEAVNTAHGNGYDLNGDQGEAFFSGTLKDLSFAVDSGIVDDVNTIAASATANGVPGDNGNAVAIADLQNTLTMNSNSATFDGYYNSTVGDVGTQVREAAKSYEYQDTVVKYLDNYRESVSGVSLDEEMVNLIQFQHGYNAAAKLISTTDELLQTLINIV